MATLADDMVMALDPVAFARDGLGFTSDTWQTEALRWAGKRLMLNCCRQAGKSTIASILALHRALYYPGALVLLVSPSLRQSGELFRKVGGSPGPTGPQAGAYRGQPAKPSAGQRLPGHQPAQ